MAKPPASPPSSDLAGVHRDREPQNGPAARDEAAQGERRARSADSPGTPTAEDAGEGRGLA